MSALWIEDTVDLVGHHRILHQVTYFESLAKGHVWECRCGEKAETLPDMAAAQRAARRHTDEAILAALAGAGLLLQPGGESRVEDSWSHPDGTSCESPEDHVAYRVSRRVTEWPDRTVLETPWLPVEGGVS